MSSPWGKWYIANDAWGDLSPNIWTWMEKGYNQEEARRAASQYSGYGGRGGHGGFYGEEGASGPKPPESVQSWKVKADKILQYWYDKYEKSTAVHVQPKFEQWTKDQYEKEKVNPDDHKLPNPGRDRRNRQ